MPAHSVPSDTAGTASRWNAANALTGVRVLLVPVFGWLLLAYDGQRPAFRVLAAVVFGAAIVTDRFDGSIARRHNLVTDVGKIMDPIADKALTGMAFVGLSVLGELWWWVTILVLGREALVTGLRLWVIRRGVMAASMGGKVKTTLQAIALLGFILPFRSFSDGWHPLGLALWWVAVAVMALAVGVTVATGAHYVARALRLRRGVAPHARPAGGRR